jgi:hypothetical protein
VYRMFGNAGPSQPYRGEISFLPTTMPDRTGLDPFDETELLVMAVAAVPQDSIKLRKWFGNDSRTGCSGSLFCVVWKPFY